MVSFFVAPKGHTHTHTHPTTRMARPGHTEVAARPSPIHGTGLFALRRIGVGEHLTHYDGEWISREKAVALDAEGEGGWLCTTGSRDVVIDGLRHPLPPKCDRAVPNAKPYGAYPYCGASSTSSTLTSGDCSLAPSAGCWVTCCNF